MHQPSEADFALLKRILRYIKANVQMGLHSISYSGSTLRAYIDSDWIRCRETRRSTGGFCTFLCSNIISWSAKRQSTIWRSSTKAEYKSLSDTSSELSWIFNLLCDVGLPQNKPVELYCDNLSFVHLSANPILHPRTKHLKAHYHYAREKVALGSLVIKHVPGTLQLADIFTKSLSQASFVSLRFKLGVVNPPTSSLQGGVRDKRKVYVTCRGFGSDKTNPRPSR